MTQSEITTTQRSVAQIGFDITRLAPKLQEYRLQGKGGEANAVEYQLDLLYAELRAARASRPKGPALNGPSPNGTKPPRRLRGT